jgi:hypothetical protein
MNPRRFTMRSKLYMLGALCLLIAGCATAAALAASSGFTPNDPGYNDYRQYYEQVGAPASWSAVLPCKNVKVAILDTGANLNNDLKGLIVGQINLAGNNNDITDTLKHGTMVASIIGATMGDKLGVPGICPGVQLLIAKVTDSSNRASGALVASGLQWALAQGARVINVSLGESPGGPPDENVRNAVQLAVSRGTVVVMAAGNTGSSDPTSNSMASSNDAAIRVGGARLDNSVDPGSNRGAWVDLAAPFTFPASWDGDVYGTVNGTSFSTAVVSGAVAQLLSYQPNLTPDQVKKYLMSSCTQTIDKSLIACGGVIDIPAALSAAGFAPTQSTTTSQTSTTATKTNTTPKATIRIAVSGGGTIRVGNSVKCSRSCTTSFVAGATVRVAATATRKSRFVSWQGLCKGNKPKCSFTAKTGTVYAKFKK